VSSGRNTPQTRTLPQRRASPAEACPLAEAGQQVLAAGERLRGIAAVRNGLPAFPVFASGACLARR